MREVDDLMKPTTAEDTVFAYVISILKERLCIPEIIFGQTHEGCPRISFPNAKGAILFSQFLSGFSCDDVTNKCNKIHLQMVKTNGFLEDFLEEREIPILSRSEDPLPYPLVEFGDDLVRINFDILGSIFYILTRAEEIASPVRDEHGRFPAKASHAYQNGYLDRPVVDEYIEILWWCMKRLWSGLERKLRQFHMVVSHDVDVPFAEAFSSPARVLRSFGGDIIKRRDPARAFKRIGNWAATRRGDFKRDTNYTFDRIMDINKKHGLQSAFYFKTACTNREFDCNYTINHPYIRQMMREIHGRGHEIGFHPSYETYKDPVQTKKEFEKLLQVCEEEGIKQIAWGGRQHYLRWEPPTTWRNWSEAGLNYDSTLSYADCAGFRCGTCHEFPVFDLEQGKELPLIERPLIVMEGTLFGENYMNLSHEEAFAHAKMLKDQCRKYGGDFTLLWHNSSFQSERDWEVYQQILQY